MNKQTSIMSIAAIMTLALGLTVGSAVVFADEPNPISYNETSEDGITATSDEPDASAEATPTSDEIAEPSDEVVTDEKVDLETGDGLDEAEVEVDCVATPDADACIAEETPMWPMYLSLGALGLVVLVFIVLNLFGRKKK